MAFLKDFVSDVGDGLLGRDFVRDYTHASKTFVSDTHALAPRLKFLFHVYFEINMEEIPLLRNHYSAAEQSNLGLLVKTISLPKFSIDTDTLNQYNAKRVVQTKIKYEPVDIVFHDDGSDFTRKLWHHYYSYYYGDSFTTEQRGDRSIYSLDMNRHNWGLLGEPAASLNNNGTKPSFFRSIKIYGLNQKRWIAYELANPMVSSWSHDEYAYSDPGGTMSNSMTVEYEYVKYFDGPATAGSTRQIPGFFDPAHYDTAPSPIGAMGNAGTITGPGGIFDTINSIVIDLSNGDIASAFLKASRLYRDRDRLDLKGSLKEELTVWLKDVLRGITTGSTITTPPPAPSTVGVAQYPSKTAPSGIIIPVDGRKKQ